MTIEQLKEKHPIIENISDEETHYEVIFIFDVAKTFDGTEEERITAINEYCTRVENILKNL